MTNHTTSNNANALRMEGSLGTRVPLELSYEGYPWRPCAKPHMAIVLSLVDKTNGEVRSRVTPDVALPRSLRKAIAD
jgi:hypothetical protein